MRNKQAAFSLLILAMALLLAEADDTLAQQQSRKDAQLPELVYVVGQVVKPRAIPFKPTITVLQAIARAGGVLPDGGMERVRILRPPTEDKTRTIVVVDLKAIAKRRAEDILLHPYEIVEVLSKKSDKRRKKECPHPPCVKIESIVLPKNRPFGLIL